MLFATGEKAEAIAAAKEFGQGTVVVAVNEKTGNRQRIFTAVYQTEIGLAG